MESVIYALVDPNDDLVKYIGQTVNPHVRMQMHRSSAQTGCSKPVYEWMRSLLPKAPVLIILEIVPHRRIQGNLVGLVSVMEAKWLKRFRRTVLNYDREQCAAYGDFVNPPEVTRKYYTEEK